tara:strand:- start:168 stop:902 length:735 start_codon:yes stop_codon:yes gene_type:complete
MLYKNPKKLVKKILNYFGWSLIKINRSLPNSYVYEKPNFKNVYRLLKCNGIIHWGAHRGKEAEVYSWFNKKVLWIEANPIIFEDLQNHIKFFYNQKAINTLLGDKNNKIVNFFISNKDASCSSIFNLSKKVIEGKLWKKDNVKMISSIKLKMKTFDQIIKNKNIKIKGYDHWIIDLQGAEIHALKGSIKSLKYCNSLSVEISKRDYYENGATKWNDLRKFLVSKGFKLEVKPKGDHSEALFVRK